MFDVLVGLVHLLVFPGGLFALGFGLWLKGCDRRLEARLQRRVGAPLMQPFWDMAKLCTKEVILPKTAFRTLFIAAPVVALGGIAVCAALLPIPGVTEGLPQLGDMLVILYLFPFPALALMLAGSASGSPYGGIGFSREMLMMLAYELPLLVILVTIAMAVGTATGVGAEFSLTNIVQYQQEHGSFGFQWSMLPALVAWMLFIPATLGIAPFDQPEAETEILEGALLEYSGVLLALFQMAQAVKLVVVLALGVILFFPGVPVSGLSEMSLFGALFGLVLNMIWFVVKCGLFMIVGVTLMKASTGRLRIEQSLSFFLKYPTSLALLSLALMWLGC